MSNNMTGGTEDNWMRRISISYELREDRCYDSLIQRLHYLGAEPRLPTQWILLTTLTAEEIRRDLQDYIDSADRLLVTQVTSMSYRNLITSDKVGSGAA
jgi:hypothetical protein